MRFVKAVAALAMIATATVGVTGAASAAEVTSSSCSWLPSGVYADTCVTIDADAGVQDTHQNFGRIWRGKTVAVRITDSNVSAVSAFGTRNRTAVRVTDLQGQPVSGYAATRRGTATDDACDGADSCSLLVRYWTSNRRSTARLTLSHTPAPVVSPPAPPVIAPSLPSGHPRTGVPFDTPRYNGRTALIQADADVAASLGVPLCVGTFGTYECVNPDGSTFVVREPSFNDPGSPSARQQVPDGIFFARYFTSPPPPPPPSGTLPGFNKITQANLDLAIAENTPVCVRDGVPFECVRPDGSRFSVTGSFEEPAQGLYPDFIFVL